MTKTEYGIDEMILCVQREINFRQASFPELVAEGSLTEAAARLEINLMIAIGEHLIRSRNSIFTAL